MLNSVTVRSYGAPEYNKKEIFRYAGAYEISDDISALVDECLAEIDGRLTFKVCYREFPIVREGRDVDLGFVRTASKDLAKNLDRCESIVLFGATVGIETDRMIAKYSRLSPSKALVFQAIGAERIESLCELFSKEIAEEKKKLGKTCRPRFSPGYGDLPIETQRDIFRVLDCPRKIGLTLNSSLIMSPTKSVTAIIGVGGEKQEKTSETKRIS